MLGVSLAQDLPGFLSLSQQPAALQKRAAGAGGPMRTSLKRKPARTATAQLFAETQSAPAIGGLVLSMQLNEFTLPPEVVLFEPSPGEIFRGGTPAPQSKSGNRLIFLNVPLLDFEQAALNKLHEALKNENTLAPGGTMPSYVRLHALRLLQQAKWKVEKALHTIATHLEMRVQKMPVSEESVLQDLQSTIMYWHGRDRACRPVLVWRMEKAYTLGLDSDRATRMILFILEYAVRYLMVPGRVENWVLLVDLTGCGMSMAASSTFRSITRNVTRLLEEVYCGRNYTTKIFHMPSLLRAIVNSLIPEDKKSKVEFVSDADIKTSMRKLCEPHQIEEQYGGTAPNVKTGEVYPFRFFPHCRGPQSGGSPPLASVHEVTDRLFHEGVSLDAHEKEQWRDIIHEQPLTASTCETVGDMNLRPTTTLEAWLEKLQGPEAVKYSKSLTASADEPGISTRAEDPTAEVPAPATPVAVLPPDDIFNQDAIKTALQDDINNGRLITEKNPAPLMEGESSAVCCVCTV